ncbi:hypothetical protein EK21DRAFT_94680 [Setomelanomma holmii]|uniref:Uncharacterized protein n=1 Tax=Setomelanomma holmii TaxID=210430 RepID=A0A9P4GVL7_9PLEO|nr:hypothetical protein EK21DRAFT_94680 [Setomelanomma holmii]
MRVFNLALGALGLAGFSAGLAVNNEASSSSSYAAPPITSLTRSITSQSMPTPTRSLHTVTVYQRGDEHRRQAVPPFTGCLSGYTSFTKTYSWMTCSRTWLEKPTCTPTSTSVGLACTQTACPNGYRPRPPFDTTVSTMSGSAVTTITKSWTDGESCIWTMPLTTTDSTRHVAQFAQATPASETNDGLSHRWVAVFAATTNDLGGRSQRAVAQFAQATPPSVPICSFNREQGVYDCSTGYEAKIASATTAPGKNLGARMCPPGVDACDPSTLTFSTSASTSKDIHISQTLPEFSATANGIPPPEFFSTHCPSDAIGLCQLL